MFNVDVDFEADDRASPSPGTPGHRSHRPRFSPCLSEAEPYTGEINDSINDTHLQYGLERHPFA